jgi:hypothetical protein
MKTKVIWIDDFREPYNFLYDEGYKAKEIKVCKNYSQFVEAIEKEGLPELICYDHDLGEEKTGYDCAKYIVNYCLERKEQLPDWYIQSSNIVGALNIDDLFKAFKRSQGEKK